MNRDVGCNADEPVIDHAWRRQVLNFDGDEEEVRVCVRCGDIHPDDDGTDIHTWFSLTYSNYLVIPRTFLQSMPRRWQIEFVNMLDGLREQMVAGEWPEAYGYRVMAVDSAGRFAKDPCPHYNRGRTRLPREKEDHAHQDSAAV